MKLSVLILSFNHARYIEQAVRSALMQETAFEYEVVVADDASTDGTTAIVERLASEFPNQLRMLPRDRRLGVQDNFFDGYASCRGSYLALLDGDDYWLSPYKLQRQVNFLDQHAQCALCFHNVLLVHDDGQPEALACDPARSQLAGIEDLLIENFIPTSAVVYRHGLLKQFPSWSRELITWDWLLHILHAQYGRVGYLGDPMAVSRRHAAGLWSGAEPSVRTESTMQMLEHLNHHFNRKYQSVVRASIARWQSTAKLEDLHRACKRLEGEWQRDVERLQVERTAAMNELWMQHRELMRDREHLDHDLQRVSREKDQIASEKALALREISELRRLVEEQRSILSELRTAMETNATREETVGSETIRGLAAVDHRLTEIHRWMDVQRTRELVEAVVPPGATVIVVSKGDAELLQLSRRRGWHFPQTDNGVYAGAYPATSQAAIDHLEALRTQGAQYLVFPGSSLWWLEYYGEFRAYLEERFGVALRRDGECLIFDLTAPLAEAALPGSGSRGAVGA